MPRTIVIDDAEWEVLEAAFNMAEQEYEFQAEETDSAQWRAVYERDLKRTRALWERISSQGGEG